jgi:RNA polymerase sigma-70 factor (ECF subfamily)
MAQEFINKYRRQRKLVSLDEEEESGAQFVAKDDQPPATVDPRLESATSEAIATLSGEDRFVLAAYYLDRQTLADIAQALSLHESTVSRKLDKLAKAIRKQILHNLLQQGMSRAQAEDALDVDVRDLQLNIRKQLTQKTETQTVPNQGDKQPDSNKADGQIADGSMEPSEDGA